MSEQKFAKYVAEDIQVQKDGHVMMTVDVAKELNRKSYLEKKVTELEAELDKCHEVLSGIYESGLKLDEYENPVREALGLTKL